MWGALIGAGASLVGSLFGGGSKKQETTTTSYVDYARMVRDAEAAGFNPLTALRNGGAAGFSVTTGTTPATPLSARLADGVAGATQSFLANFDPFSDKKRELEYSVIEAQLHNLQADTALKISEKNKFGSLPSVTGRPRTLAERPALSKKSAPSSGSSVTLPPSDGQSQRPTVEQPTVTNPYPSAWGGSVNPNVPDAAMWEERYGDSELLSMGVGIMNGVADISYNVSPHLSRVAKAASKPFKSEWQKRKEAYDAWRNGSPLPPPLSGKRSRLRSYQ